MPLNFLLQRLNDGENQYRFGDRTIITAPSLWIKGGGALNEPQPLVEALQTEYLTDTYFICYDKTFRATKDSPPDDLCFRYMGFDVDFDKHRGRPTDADWESLDVGLRNMAVIYPKTPPTLAWPTRGGARVLFLTQPIRDPMRYEYHWQWLKRRLAEALGSARLYQPDNATSDWTRLQRMPKVVRYDTWVDPAVFGLRWDQQYAPHMPEQLLKKLRDDGIDPAAKRYQIKWYVRNHPDVLPQTVQEWKSLGLYSDSTVYYYSSTECDFTEKQQVVPKPRKVKWNSKGTKSGYKERFLEATAYVQNDAPEAVSGDHGSGRTCAVIIRILRYDLNETDTRLLIDWYNDNKCDPSWSEIEIENKLHWCLRKIEKDM